MMRKVVFFIVVFSLFCSILKIKPVQASVEKLIDSYQVAPVLAPWYEDATDQM